MPYATDLTLAWRLLVPPAGTALVALLFWLGYVGPGGMRRPLLRALMVHGSIFLYGVCTFIMWEDKLWQLTHFEWAWLALTVVWGWLVLRDALRRYRRPAEAPSATPRVVVSGEAALVAAARGRRARAEALWTAGWMLTLVGALLAWNGRVDGLTGWAAPLLLTAAAAGCVLAPGPRRARIIAGLKLVIPLLILGLIAEPGWPLLALVGLLALALWILTRRAGSARIQDAGGLGEG